MASKNQTLSSNKGRPGLTNVSRRLRYPILLLGVVSLFFALGYWVLHLSRASGTGRNWIMAHGALDQMTSDAGARAGILADTIYSPGFNPANATEGEQGLNIIPVKTFTSEQTFANDLLAGTIPGYVKAVLYDNEPWSLTPSAERANVVSYYQQFAALAHAHGLIMISTPVPNSYAPKVAPYSDVVDVQAQFAQSSVSAYLKASRAALEDSAAANPKAIMLSGLSTNPSAGDPTPPQLLNIAHATFPSLVQGWWLNIPNPGTACPNCRPPRPDIGIAFLTALGPNTNPQHHSQTK